MNDRVMIMPMFRSDDGGELSSADPTANSGHAWATSWQGSVTACRTIEDPTDVILPIKNRTEAANMVDTKKKKKNFSIHTKRFLRTIFMNAVVREVSRRGLRRNYPALHPPGQLAEAQLVGE